LGVVVIVVVGVGPMMMSRLSLLLFAVLFSTPSVAFVAGSSRSTVLFGVSTRHATTNTAASSPTTSDDILKPPYEIERIPTRIGHGFDIHRMAPIQDAGQPIVIGGVVIPHSDQKVSVIHYIMTND
jgi:2-C-methyl-D-erythritol 2,4-cyclodiphosphate synthase